MVRKQQRHFNEIAAPSQDIIDLHADEVQPWDSAAIASVKE